MLPKELVIELSRYLKYYDLLNFSGGLSLLGSANGYADIGHTEWKDRIEKDFIYLLSGRMKRLYCVFNDLLQRLVFGDNISPKNVYLLCSYHQLKIDDLMCHNSMDHIDKFLNNKIHDDKDKEIISIIEKSEVKRRKLI